MNIPRIVVAGTHSGVGKTSITLGLLRAFSRRGLTIQPFKVGPDYIDPGLHSAAAGVTSHNLDSWMGSETEIKSLFQKASLGKDLSIVEGVMGLFDGARGQGEAGSTAQVAKIINAPVILIFSAKGLARSAAALLKGYRDFDPGLDLCGVIANGISSQRHYDFIKETVQENLGIPFFGGLSTNREMSIPERHLGLVPAEENTGLHRIIDNLADLMEQQIEVDSILETARQRAAWQQLNPACVPISKSSVRIGIARDQAFSFYYQDSLDCLNELGAELVPFSPLRDRVLPSGLDGLYLGGGFPEEFLPTLTSNKEMHREIQAAYNLAMPIYAECGGLMYLCRTISSRTGETYPGVGLVPAETKMGRGVSLGYVKARLETDNILGTCGQIFKGHEFHWSYLSDLAPVCPAYTLSGGRGIEGRVEGYAYGSLLASYVHLHFRYNQGAAVNFIKSCRTYKEQGNVNVHRA